MAGEDVMVLTVCVLGILHRGLWRTLWGPFAVQIPVWQWSHICDDTHTPLALTSTAKTIL